MSEYTYLRKTTHPTPEDALRAAFRDIENNLADPVEITDDDLKNDDLIYSAEQIGELFVQSNHEPLPPPIIKARIIDRPTSKKSDLFDWIVSKLHGKPGHWS